MRQNNTFHTTVTLIMREQIFLTEGLNISSYFNSLYIYIRLGFHVCISVFQRCFFYCDESKPEHE